MSPTPSMDHQEIPRRSGSGPVPLSYAQELLWLMDRASPGVTAWSVPRALRLRGRLDRVALQRSLDALVERHEALRTVFVGAEGSAQQVVRPANGVPMHVVDLTHLSADARAAEAARLGAAHAATPFDLANDLLFRAKLLVLGDAEHVLLLNSHHIVSDGWSRSVMFRELSALYPAFQRGETAALPPLPIQYADYAVWERGAEHERALAESLTYWREQLGGVLPELDLPTDLERPDTPGFAGALHTATLPPALTAALQKLAQDNDVTFYMLMLAAYVTVLHWYSGQDDIIVGSPIAGRTQSETEGLIGYFANTMVMRTDCAGDPTFAELLERVRDTCLGAYEHHDVPLEKLVLEIQRAAQLRPGPLFQVVLTMEETIPAALDLGGIAVEPIQADEGSTKFDLTLLFSNQPDGMHLRFAYRADLFSAPLAERFLVHFCRVLESVAKTPSLRLSSIPLLSSPERAQLNAWQGPSVGEGPAATVVSLFEAQVRRVPDRMAVVGPRTSATASGSIAGTLPISYRELNARANQLAHHLIAQGVERNAPVGILLDRRVDAVVGIIATLKAGGAFVPLAVDAPAARVAQQLAECGARFVVTTQSLLGQVPQGIGMIALDREADAALLAALPDTDPVRAVVPADLAYVLYTSGSTGVPKGVAVTHANIVHYVRAVSRVLGDVPASASGDGLAALDGMRFGMVSTFAADLGNTVLFPSLLAGGTLHLLAKDVTTEPARFAEYVSVHPFDVLKITPSHLAALTAGKSGAEFAGTLPRSWLVLGGEALRPDFAAQLLRAGACRVLNHYGPTETTVGVCTLEVTEAVLADTRRQGARTVPIGRPLANTRAWVVDGAGNPQPIGVRGELWLGGDGVTAGYLRRPELTAERFVEIDGQRAYRTGDRVRWLGNGVLEFLGRADDQVKVRGFRVEPAEIEQVLRGHPGVAEAVVVLRDDGAEEPWLVAYVVTRQGGYAVSHSDRPTPEKLLERVTAELPPQMVPSAVVLLDALPLTPNGKLDRRALPAPGAATQGIAESRIAPRTPTEETVARIWRDVLKKDELGITESFLDLGGHSLLAIRVLGRISKELGVRLPLRALFETPTVEKISAVIDAERNEKAIQEALAAVGEMSDAEVARLLADERSVEPGP